MLRRAVIRVVAVLVCLFPRLLFGQLSATDDFESYPGNPIGQFGGSGDWTSLWGTNLQNGGGTFLSGSSKIDGTRSLGLFGSSSASGRSVSRSFLLCTNEITIRFSMRADYNVASTGRVAFTVRRDNEFDHFAGQRLSFFYFVGTTNFQWYDGTDRSSNAVYFITGHVYSVGVTLDPATRSYSFTASNRNNGAHFSYAGNWTTGFDGQPLGSVAFMMRGPSGAGNDAFLDSVEIEAPSYDAVQSGPSWREGAEWRYFKGTQTPPNQGTNRWHDFDYTETGWTGPAPSGFGYGDCDDATVLADMSNNYVTVFTRKRFVVGDPATITQLTMAVDYDDGFVAFLNGVEVARANVTSNVITHLAFASASRESSRGEKEATPMADEKQFLALDPGLLRSGTNVLAVSGHNSSLASSDLTLIVELYTNSALARGPFIQMPNPAEMTVAWRTAALTDGAVDYGLDAGYAGGTVSDPALVRDHAIGVPGLLPGTQYYYRVRGSGETLSEGHQFHTAPASHQPFRFVVLGDFGAGSVGMSNVAARINERTDFDALMTVGDNIYGGGCNFDGAPGWYDPFWFQLYAPTMRRVPTFPSLGNHDVDTATGYWMTAFFHLPTNGPPGLLEKNYSFPFGNAHIISIDTEPFEDNQTGDMAAITNWLAGDLAAATLPWKIALLHRPPYTSQGRHNDQTAVKAQVVPILERGGVQMVFQGHNHFYERHNAINGVRYVTSGGGGAGLYAFNTVKEYSFVRYNAQHSYLVVEINGGVMTGQAYNEFGALLDTWQFEIDHAFAIDGLLDDGSWLRAQNGMRLYAAIRGNFLYVATQDAGEGNDHFIYVASQISTQRPANWVKSGTVMQWGAFLADENGNAFHGWHGPDEAPLTDPGVYRSMTSGLNNNAPGTNGVLEGSLHLAAHFGSFPTQLLFAVGPFVTTNAGHLTAGVQVPAGNGDGHIQSNEFLALAARDIALDLPVAVARSNQTAEAGMAVALDGADSSAPSGLPLSFAWTQLDGPPGYFQDPNGALTAFVLSNNVPFTTSVVVDLTVNDTRFDSNAVVTLTFYPMVDSDGDGLSDQEELTGVNNTLTIADPAGRVTLPDNPDSDDDGVPDGAEAIAGTNPNDGASRFEIVDLGGVEVEGLVIQWSSASNRVYTLYKATNITDVFDVLASNLTATTPLNVYTDQNANADTSFYIIDVRPLAPW
jgi:hypothetical protein